MAVNRSVKLGFFLVNSSSVTGSGARVCFEVDRFLDGAS